MTSEEIILAQEAEELLKQTYYCDEYKCTILPAACARRYAAAQAGTDKINDEVDFELCLVCERGLLAFKESGMTLPEINESQNKDAKRRRWMKNSGDLKWKMKPCDTCHELFQPTGGRQKTCPKCKPPKDKIATRPDTVCAPEPSPFPARWTEPETKPSPGQIINEVPVPCEGVVQRMSADLQAKLTEARELYIALKVLQRYDDSIRLPEMTMRDL